MGGKVLRSLFVFKTFFFPGFSASQVGWPENRWGYSIIIHFGEGGRGKNQAKFPWEGGDFVCKKGGARRISA